MVIFTLHTRWLSTDSSECVLRDGEEVERVRDPSRSFLWMAGKFLLRKLPGNASCLFIYFLAASVGLWDLSSPIRDGTCTPPAVEVHSLNQGITREVQSSAFYWPQLGHVPKTMSHGQWSELSSWVFRLSHISHLLLTPPKLAIPHRTPPPHPQRTIAPHWEVNKRQWEVVTNRRGNEFTETVSFAQYYSQWGLSEAGLQRLPECLLISCNLFSALETKAPSLQNS